MNKNNITSHFKKMKIKKKALKDSILNQQSKKEMSDVIENTENKKVLR